MEEQQSDLTKVISHQKKNFFQYTSTLVSQQFPHLLYFFLIGVQTVQIIGFQLHSSIQYNSIGLSEFRTVSNYLNMEFFFRTANIMNWWLPVCFVLVLIHAGVSYQTYFKGGFRQAERMERILKSSPGDGNRQKSNIAFSEQEQSQSSDSNRSGVQKLLMKVQHYLIMLMCTVGVIPIFTPSILVIYCHDESPYHQLRQCYDTYHLALIIMGICNAVWVFGVNVYFSLFYFTNNPFCSLENVLSFSSPLWSLLKFMVKFVPTGYLIFDEKMEFDVLFIFGVAAGLAGYWAIVRVLYPYERFNRKVDRFMVYNEIIPACVATLLILQKFFIQPPGTGGNICFLFSILMGVPLARFAWKVFSDKKEELILEINNFEKDNTDSMQELMHYLIVLLEEAQSDGASGVRSQGAGDAGPRSSLRIFKAVKFHAEQCEDVACRCGQYLEQFEGSDEYYLESELVYKIMVGIMERMIEVNRKAYSMSILKSYVELHRLKNPIKASYILSKILNEKISFMEEYLVTGVLFELSNGLRDRSDMSRYRVFSEHLTAFEKEAIRLATLYSEYWSELIEQNSSFGRLSALIAKARDCKQVIDWEFEQLRAIYPTNLRALHIYKEVHKEVLMQLDGFLKYHKIYRENQSSLSAGSASRSGGSSRFLPTDQRIKFQSNEDIVVLNTSVNSSNDIFHGGCEIVSVSNNAHKVLGFAAKDLTGKNINRFLPKIYAEFHDGIIERFLNRDQEQAAANQQQQNDANGAKDGLSASRSPKGEHAGSHQPREITIFPLNSSGNIVECVLLNKVIPSIEYGVNIVSFMKPSSDEKQSSCIIYDQRTGLIDSMTKRAEQSLGIKSKSSKSTISMPDHISDVLPVWNPQTEQLDLEKVRSSKHLHETFSFLELFRSDGPVTVGSDEKYAKILKFELEFSGQMFSMGECFESQQSGLWMIGGLQTLMDNSPQKLNDGQIEEDELLQGSDDGNQKGGVGTATKNSSLQTKGKNNKEDFGPQPFEKQLEEITPTFRFAYIGIQCVIGCVFGFLLIYFYQEMISVHHEYESDAHVKQLIEQIGVLPMKISTDVSHYLHNGGSSMVMQSVNLAQNALLAKEMQSKMQLIYQDLLLKESEGFVSFQKELLIDVNYFNGGPQAVTQKRQLISDAVYQFSTYLIEVLEDPTAAVVSTASSNNVLFIFMNNEQITQALSDLNELYTAIINQKYSDRNAKTVSLVIAFLCLFALTLSVKGVYEYVIISKIDRVIEVFGFVPVDELEKYPKKCANFIRSVSPDLSNGGFVRSTLKSINEIGISLSKNLISNHSYQKDHESSQLLAEEQAEVQMASFIGVPSMSSTIVQSIVFLVFFALLFVTGQIVESEKLSSDTSVIRQWTVVNSFVFEVPKLNYFLNEFNNLGSQWNQSAAQEFQSKYQQSVQEIQLLLNQYSQLDEYLSRTYSLVDNSKSIALATAAPAADHISHLLSSQKNFLEFTEALETTYMRGYVQSVLADQNEDLFTVMELIFVIELIAFLGYVFVYLPLMYAKGFDRYQAGRLMYQTLGGRLLNIATQNQKVSTRENVRTKI